MVYRQSSIKKFLKDIIPELVTLYNEIWETETMPTSMSEALITLILKPDKDPMECGSYRPISLLNTDYKIFTKMLANHLNEVIRVLVHPDQVGFIVGRQASDHLRRLRHLIWKVRDSNVPVAAISLDAEKAFDRVEWEYLHHTLEKFGFGPKFRHLILALYSTPTARIITNGTKSEPIRIGRGTRQGCPLLPLLFALSLEPLAARIRTKEHIQGISVGTQQHKILLYADDILLLVSDPSNSVPHIMDTIENYSKYLGYKINWGKSEVLPLTDTCH